jgi:hypothetical protein
MEAKAGVVTAAEVNGPIASPSGKVAGMWDASSPATWSVVWFLVAILILFVL